jgi:hypothetical protein
VESQSVRFYDIVLGPLGIPKIAEHQGEACFTNLNVVDRRPATQNLHLCFYARAKEHVDAFHRAGVQAGFRSNGAPGYRDYAPGYYAAYLFDPDGNNVEALYRDVGERRPPNECFPALTGTSGAITRGQRRGFSPQLQSCLYPRLCLLGHDGAFA